MTTDDQTQLDRIEAKFDRIIEILNDLKNAREARIELYASGSGGPGDAVEDTTMADPEPKWLTIGSTPGTKPFN